MNDVSIFSGSYSSGGGGLMVMALSRVEFCEAPFSHWYMSWLWVYGVCSSLLPTMVNRLLESVYFLECGCPISIRPGRSRRRSCKLFVMTGSSVSRKWRPHCAKLTI